MRITALLFSVLISSCQYYNGKLPVTKPQEESTEIVQAKVNLLQPTDATVTTKSTTKTSVINTNGTKPDQLLAFAQTLIGVPYRYGSSDPVNGFDCSGFITYVFNHFNITVPRSSIEFTNYEKQVNLNEAKTGDLILFTGTDSTIREVGHMGIITSVNNGQIEFIHSSSGKANGVTITPLNTYYMGRFVKVIRVF
jgi:cell wall-associated NlpC family hydrolase